MMVTTLMLFINNGIPGIHLVGTLDEFRGKGYGTSITLKAMKDLKDAGFVKAVLQASQMGENIYKKIGFKKYSELFHWGYNFH